MNIQKARKWTKPVRLAITVLTICLLLLVVSTLSSMRAWATSVEINETTFPDPAFRAYVSEELDLDASGELSTEEIEEATWIELFDIPCASLQGIEYLTELRDLYLYYIPVDSFDLSRNTKLEHLEISNIPLTSLVLNDMPSLQGVTLGNLNQLSYLEVRDNPVMEQFMLYQEDWHIAGGAIGKVDAIVSGNPSLESLSFNSTSLSSLVVDDCEMLGVVSLGQYGPYGPRGLEIDSVIVSNCPSLEGFDCYQVNIGSLTLRDCSILGYIYTFSAQIDTIDVHDCPSLTMLYCGYVQLSSLNVSNCPNLTQLYCATNQLTSLDLQGCPALRSIDFADNLLTSFDGAPTPCSRTSTAETTSSPPLM